MKNDPVSKGGKMGIRQKITALLWFGALILFALLVSVFPDTRWQSIAITQAPLVPVTLLIIYSLSLGRLAEKPLRVAIAGAALWGFSCAAYLGISWASGEFPVCATGGCTAAQYSSGADIFFGIRTTTVGMIGYTLVFLSLLFPGNLGRFSTAFLGTFGFATSVYLTHYSITELATTCQWCLGSAAAMTAICGLSYLRLWRFIE